MNLKGGTFIWEILNTFTLEHGEKQVRADRAFKLLFIATRPGHPWHYRLDLETSPQLRNLPFSLITPEHRVGKPHYRITADGEYIIGVRVNKWLHTPRIFYFLIRMLQECDRDGSNEPLLCWNRQF